MEAEAISPILTPVIQYGFAGFSVILLGVVIWLMKAQMSLQRDTIRVIEQNTSAIKDVLVYHKRNEPKIDDIQMMLKRWD